MFFVLFYLNYKKRIENKQEIDLVHGTLKLILRQFLSFFFLTTATHFRESFIVHLLFAFHRGRCSC